MHTPKPVMEVIKHVQLLQREAREPADVEKRIPEMAEIFAEAARALGHTDFRGHGWSRAKMRTFKFQSDAIISHTFKDRCFPDPYMQKQQVYVSLAYNTDVSTGFDYVLARVSELGLYLDPLMKTTYNNGAYEQRLFFSPSKWPFIASILICSVYKNPRAPKVTANALLQDLYPNVAINSVEALVGSGIFEKPSEFCNWLLYSNQLAVPTDTQITVPTSF